MALDSVSMYSCGFYVCPVELDILQSLSCSFCSCCCCVQLSYAM